jgi:hypothetical protein
MAGGKHENAPCPFQPGILPSGFEPVYAAVARKQQDSVTSAGKASSGFRVLLVDEMSLRRWSTEEPLVPAPQSELPPRRTEWVLVSLQ